MLEEYIATAIEHSRASESGDFRRANRCADRLAELRDALQASGKLRQVLRPLLRHHEPAVALWAAADLLLAGPDNDALEALERVAREHAGTSLGFDARITLEEWRAGRLGASPAASQPVQESETPRAIVHPAQPDLAGYVDTDGSVRIAPASGASWADEGVIEIAGDVYLSLDEMGVLQAVTFRPPVAEWQPLSPVPRPPRCREAGQIAFAREDTNVYYYDPPLGVRLLADYEQGVFRASFGDQGGRVGDDW